MSTQETFVDGLGNVAVQAALARIELTQLKSLPAEGQKPVFEVTSRLVMSIETFLKMHQSFTEVINQMESKGLIRKAGDAPVAAKKHWPRKSKLVSQHHLHAVRAKDKTQRLRNRFCHLPGHHYRLATILVDDFIG